MGLQSWFQMTEIFPRQTYLITDGSATPETFTADLPTILDLIKKAVVHGFSMVQIREKALFTRQLFELSHLAAEITGEGETKLLINDRADVAFVAGADGVHLTSHSLPAAVVRQNFPAGFVIGVSTHSVETALDAKKQG